MNTTTPNEPRPALDEGAMYMGDGGRIFCGTLACAGTTAHFTGCDLSGQPVERFSKFAIRAWTQQMGGAPECEGCGRRGGRA
jgi:hypothetical protein